MSPDANEFAILNNGITIVCDESSISEQSGRLHRAQIFLVNPQIINGGQTAYTLSRIYDRLDPDKKEEVFAGKEVLVKAIALTDRGDATTDEERRITFIERISMATNSQTLVTSADRKSGDTLHSQIQAALFDRYGLLYERKRGEFSDGIKDGYISSRDVVNRVLFARLFYAANGHLSLALTKRILDRHEPAIIEDRTKLDRFVAALAAFELLSGGKVVTSRRRFTEILPKIYAASIIVSEGVAVKELHDSGVAAARLVQNRWSSFVASAAQDGARYVRTTVDPKTGGFRAEMKESRGSFGDAFQIDARKFFTNLGI
jgi:hypothetical protein